MKPKAATLAVGTEVTDGQIIDRNSAWISQKLVHAGVPVIEHRAVADDRADIARALKELSLRADLLFVTGGLGPTSDDFTRDVLSEVFQLPLEFDPGSWQHIQETLGKRGIAVREIQRQQCFFPRGSRVLTNTAGTANAFAFDATSENRSMKVYALPGPPAEIAAVWEKHLQKEIEALVPLAEREELKILRCLGKGESEVAEITEEEIKGSSLRVGYRAHIPYVEVKLWYNVAEKASSLKVVERLQEKLKTVIVNQDEEDAADALIDYALSGQAVTVSDEATFGLLHERIATRIKDRKLNENHLPIKIESRFFAAGEAKLSGEGLSIAIDAGKAVWKVKISKKSLKTGELTSVELEVPPAFQYKIQTERARRYITEKALLLFAD